MEGKLLLCATPIGNLDDITIRVLNTLKEVDYIAAEDTRHTLKLLNHFDIKKPLLSYHEHNKRDMGVKLIDLLKEGHNIALVSDAGMPGISDPGWDLVVLAYENGLSVTALPGATAFATALVISGLDTSRFVFDGFLPIDKKLRQKRLSELKDEQRTIILYEAPHKLRPTLYDLHKELGDRDIAIVRELTKIHEEVLKMSISQVISYYKEHDIKGEIVLVIEGKDHEEQSLSFDHITIEEHIMKYMEAGLDKKQAIKQVAKDRDIPKSEVYRFSLEI